MTTMAKSLSQYAMPDAEIVSSLRRPVATRTRREVSTRNKTSDAAVPTAKKRKLRVPLGGLRLSARVKPWSPLNRENDANAKPRQYNARTAMWEGV